jgi:GT2 family glycosyltransferase
LKAKFSENGRSVTDGRQVCAPSVGAVVVNFNGGEDVIRCLESLCCEPVLLREIIVVDNASTDNSPALIAKRYPNVRIHQLDQNFGPCVARNAGLDALSTDLALFMDDDVYLAQGALGLMLKGYAESEAQIVCPRILLYPDTNIIHCDGAAPYFLGTLSLRHGFTPRGEHDPSVVVSMAVDVHGCLSACLLADRNIVLQAGGFDEAYFFYFEDLEFSLRLRSLGHAVVCLEDAVAYHDRGSGTPGLAFRGVAVYPEKRFYLSARNRLMTIFIHYRLKTIILLSPALLIYELLVIVFALRQGFAGLWFRSWRWQAENYSLLKTRRARVQNSRKLADADLLSGGPVPIAPGLIRSRPVNWAVITLSAFLAIYWRLVRPFLG